MQYVRFIIPALLLISSSVAAASIANIKNSTAFLVVPGNRASGTAFCISDKGYFATCAHVIEGLNLGQEVSLTANSGLPNAKTTQAEIIKIDNSLDLAILKTKPGFCPALKMGNSENLRETNKITAAGFPFGNLIAQGKTPAISISTGQVTAIRRDGKLISRVQFDAEIQPGNSGGPLLNEKGEVVGVVVSKIIASRINFAIGTDLLKAMWITPQCEIEQPEIIPFSARHKPTTLKLNLDYISPPKTSPEITAVFVGSKSKPRPVTIKKSGETSYTLTGIPHPQKLQVSGNILRSELVRVSGSFTHKNIVSHRNVKFKIGTNSYNLSDFRAIEPQNGIAITNKGRTIKGAISGLSQVPLYRPGHSSSNTSFINWPLICTRPERNTIEPIHVEVKIITGDFVTTVTRPLSIDTPDGVGNLNLLPGGATFNEADAPISGIDKPIEITLDDEMADLDYGGNGRYLVAQIPTMNLCLIIDCLSGKITHKIPTKSNARIAAGLTTLFIADSSGLSKWDLETGKNIARDLKWINGKVHALTAGSGSDRFFGVLYSAFNIDDLVRLELRAQASGIPLALEPLGQSIPTRSLIKISEHGTSIGVYSSRIDQPSLGLLRIKDDVYNLNEHKSSGWINPGPTDRMILTGRGDLGLAQQGFGELGNQPKKFGLVPTSIQDLALMVPLPSKGATPGKPPQIGLYNTNTGRPLASNISTLDGFEDLRLQSNRSSRDSNIPRLSWDKRFQYSVAHELLVTIPPGDGLVKVRPLPLKEILEKVREPYLLLHPSAPVRVKGTKFEAQLKTFTSEATPTFEILNAPEKFTINSTGVLQGPVNPAHAGSMVDLLVRIKAGNLERLWSHSFSIE